MKTAFDVCKQNFSHKEVATTFESVHILFERQCMRALLKCEQCIRIENQYLHRGEVHKAKQYGNELDLHLTVISC